MRRSFRQSRQTRRPRLTQAQADAIRRAFDAAPATVEGRFAKGQLVADGDQVWKVVSRGIRYHEDVSSALYGVAPVARPPKEWRATRMLRQAIETVLRTGVHTPESRGAKFDGSDLAVPTGSEIAKWQDAEPNSYASFPRLSLRDSDVIVAVRPNYDDSPTVAWLREPKLAKSVAEAIAIAPQPHHIAQAAVRLRAPKEP